MSMSALFIEAFNHLPVVCFMFCVLQENRHKLSTICGVPAIYTTRGIMRDTKVYKSPFHEEDYNFSGKTCKKIK